MLVKLPTIDFDLPILSLNEMRVNLNNALVSLVSQLVLLHV